MEADLRREVSRRVKARGWWVMHPVGGAYQLPGVPDLLICARGRFLAVELKDAKRYKNPYDGLSPAQQKVIYDIASAGGSVLVSNNAEEVMTWLEKESSQD